MIAWFFLFVAGRVSEISGSSLHSFKWNRMSFDPLIDILCKSKLYLNYNFVRSIICRILKIHVKCLRYIVGSLSNF